MSNSHGSSPETVETTYRIYDRLPPEIREVVRNSFHDWATGWIAEDLRGQPEFKVRDAIINFDLQQVRIDASKVWGKQAPAFLTAQPKRLYGHWFDNFPARRRARL